MSEVIVDLIEGETGRKSALGYEFERQAMVTGVTGPGVLRIREAVDAVIAVVGDIGTEHQADPTSKIFEFVPRAVSSEEILVSINYRAATFSIPLEVATIEVGTSLTQEETHEDAFHNPVTVKYTYPTTYPDPTKPPDPAKAGFTFDIGAIIPTLYPETTLVATRREFASPGTKSKQFVRRVNSGPWTLDAFCSPRQWICMAITGRSQDGGVSYDVQYVFHFREDTWDYIAVFIDPATGEPPKDLVAGQGKKTIQRFLMADFSALALP